MKYLLALLILVSGCGDSGKKNVTTLFHGQTHECITINPTTGEIFPPIDEFIASGYVKNYIDELKVFIVVKEKGDTTEFLFFRYFEDCANARQRIIDILEDNS